MHPLELYLHPTCRVNIQSYKETITVRKSIKIDTKIAEQKNATPHLLFEWIHYRILLPLTFFSFHFFSNFYTILNKEVYHAIILIIS